MPTALRLMAGDAAPPLETFIGRFGPLAQRTADGRIVEGHGDLRPEHVYLGRRLGSSIVSNSGPNSDTSIRSTNSRFSQFVGC